MASTPATRATALLMPEAVPARFLVHGIHHHGSEWSHANCESQTENDERWEKCFPIIDSRARDRKQHEAAAAMSGPTISGTLRAVTRDQAAGPSRKKKHEKYERKRSRAGRGRRISLHLDQVQGNRKKKIPTAA